MRYLIDYFHCFHCFHSGGAGWGAVSLFTECFHCFHYFHFFHCFSLVLGGWGCYEISHRVFSLFSLLGGDMSG